MRRAVIALLALSVAAVALACGDNGGGGDEFGDPVVTELPDDTFGVLDGSEDGQVMYPVLELWDIPDCRCDELITNTPHGTRVRVVAEKAECNQPQYEVEILEGPKEGIRGWVFQRFVRFDEGSEPDR